VFVRVPKRGERVVTTASGDNGTKNFGDCECRRHGMEE
jgi:hypothetical protein